MFTDAEYGMALGFADRLKAERRDAQAVVDRVARERDRAIRAFQTERAALEAALVEVGALQEYVMQLEALVRREAAGRA